MTKKKRAKGTPPPKRPQTRRYAQPDRAAYVVENPPRRPAA